MSFVKQTKMISLVLAVVVVLLVVYNLLIEFSFSDITFFQIGEFKENISFNVSTMVIAVWETFWVIVAGYFGYKILKGASTNNASALEKLEKVEKGWVLSAVAFFIIFSAITLPLAAPISSQQPEADTTIYVDSFRFKFEMNFDNAQGLEVNASNPIPAGTIKFVLHTRDVSHGFGVYNAQGDIVIQSGILPGVEQYLTIQLAAGTYTVVCMEYCGMSHHIMSTSFEVV